MFRSKDGWRVEWNENGKRRTQKFKTIEEVEDWKAKRRLGIADDSPNNKRAPTFSDFADKWLSEYSKAEKRATSHAEDRRVISRHLKPAFGSRRIASLKGADLVELKASLLAKEAKGKKTALVPKSVNNVLMVAKKIMGYAVELDLVPENKWAKVKPCKVVKADFDFWSPEERDEFYEKAKVIRPDLAQLVLLACHTGLRKGELAALTWRSVDFKRAKLRVAASYNVGLGVLSATKGGEITDLPLNAVALEVLRERAATKDGATVFPIQVFKNLRRDFGRLCRRVGVRELRFHDTRHHHASCLAMAGVDLMVIQKLLRHKSYQMTLRYAHLHPSHLTGATDVLVNPHTSHTEEKHSTEQKRNHLKGLAHPERLELPAPRFEVG